MRRYIKLHTVILDNPKVRALSSDAARWHFAKLLLHAKMTEPEGRWRSMAQLRSSVGEDTFTHAPEFMATEPEGLLVETDEGEIRVRQWWYWQGSDLNARKDDLGEQQQERKRAKERKKKATYRARKKAAEVRPEDDVHPHVHQMSTNVHPNKETESLTRTVDTSTPDGVPVPPSADASGDDTGDRCDVCKGPILTNEDTEEFTYRDRSGEPTHRRCLRF